MYRRACVSSWLNCDFRFMMYLRDQLGIEEATMQSFSIYTGVSKPVYVSTLNMAPCQSVSSSSSYYFADLLAHQYVSVCLHAHQYCVFSDPISKGQYFIFLPFPCPTKTNVRLKFQLTRSCAHIQMNVTVCMDEFPSISLVPLGDFGCVCAAGPSGREWF